MSYDKNNIFAKILRGEIPCKKIFENDYVLSFHDINPQKKIHALVIPKGEYIDLDDFNKKASDKEITEFHKAVSHVSSLLGATDKGYRVLSNIGSDGGQEVPHLHFHIFAGEKIGKKTCFITDFSIIKVSLLINFLSPIEKFGKFNAEQNLSC